MNLNVSENIFENEKKKKKNENKNEKHLSSLLQLLLHQTQKRKSA